MAGNSERSGESLKQNLNTQRHNDMFCDRYTTHKLKYIGLYTYIHIWYMNYDAGVRQTNTNESVA